MDALFAIYVGVRGDDAGERLYNWVGEMTNPSEALLKWRASYDDEDDLDIKLIDLGKPWGGYLTRISVFDSYVGFGVELWGTSWDDSPGDFDLFGFVETIRQGQEKYFKALYDLGAPESMHKASELFTRCDYW